MDSRALAREFPGALRELDCLPLDVLDLRLSVVTRAAEGGAIEQWVIWMVAYHRRMRVALAVKRRLAEVGRAETVDTAGIARWIWSELGETCDPDWVLSIARPPGGRLNRLVFGLLETELDRSSSELESTLFPEPPSAHAARESFGR